MVGILSGIAPDYHDIARQIQQLCHFVIQRIGRHDFASARQILSTLKEAFDAIAEEAQELERTGAIPGLEAAAAVDMNA